MSQWVWSALAIAWAVGGAAPPAIAGHWRDDVSVEIIDSHGRTFEQFPLSRGGEAYRAYLRAERDAPYRIRVRNATGDRVGVVVAVDGRNIISGEKSDLARGEPMYVLSPWDTQEYSGWRTNLADVHEFYFTEWENSYAEAFEDRSARGVIAVAVYREKERNRFLPLWPYSRKHHGDPEPASPNASSESSPQADSAPGTGFGERRYEPAERVKFEAERHATARVFLKYEWPETLCRKRVIDCDHERNRFWDDDELSFAPYPPRRRN